MIFNQNEQHNILLESVAEDKNFWVGCSIILILYQKIIVASTTFLSLWLLNKLQSVVVEGTQISTFFIKMNHKISYSKVLQRTRTSGLGAVSFLYYTRTFQLPPTTFLFLWLLNKLQSSVVEGTQTIRFLTKMNNKISHLKVLQRTTPSGPCALAFLQYIRTLQLPPITFFFLWLLNKLQSAVVEGTQTTRFLTKMNNNVFHLRVLQRTTLFGLGALAFVQYIRTLQLPPATFLFLWLLNKLQSTGVVGRHKIT